MQMDDDLPVHLNVPAMVTCEKVQKYPVGYPVQNILYKISLRRDGYA